MLSTQQSHKYIFNLFAACIMQEVGSLRGE